MQSESDAERNPENQSESDAERNPENQSEPYSLSKLKK